MNDAVIEAGELRRRTEGPVLTAVVRLTDPDQVPRLHTMSGLRVTEHSLGLEDIFLELMEREPHAAGDLQSSPWWVNVHGSGSGPPGEGQAPSFG